MSVVEEEPGMNATGTSAFSVDVSVHEVEEEEDLVPELRPTADVEQEVVELDDEAALAMMRHDMAGLGVDLDELLGGVAGVSDDVAEQLRTKALHWRMQVEDLAQERVRLRGAGRSLRKDLAKVRLDNSDIIKQAMRLLGLDFEMLHDQPKHVIHGAIHQQPLPEVRDSEELLLRTTTHKDERIGAVEQALAAERAQKGGHIECLEEQVQLLQERLNKMDGELGDDFDFLPAALRQSQAKHYEQQQSHRRELINRGRDYDVARDLERKQSARAVELVQRGASLTFLWILHHPKLPRARNSLSDPQGGP
jgi:hypothetical protein|eukprot:SAG25_NODE_480_length_7508_cov_8.128627_2_plen_308_part_00